MPNEQKTNFARIAAILSGFDGINTPRQSTDIVADIGASRSTGFGLIRAMVQAGWLKRVDHGIVCLGPRAAQLMHIPLEVEQALRDSSSVIQSTSTARLTSQSELSRRQEWVPELLTLVQTQHYARPGPHRIAFANASLGNPWRKAMLNSMKYAKHLQGDRISQLWVANANDDPKLQLSQVNEFAAAGADLLIISQTTLDNEELSERLIELAQSGLPIVALDRRPKMQDSLVTFVTASDRRIGRMSAIWMAEKLAGHGRIWMLSGLEGASPSIRRQSAALEAFSEFPDIQIEAIQYTNWTKDGGYKAIDRLLAEGFNPPNGVWCDSGIQGLGSLSRFLEHGGDLPAHTGGDLNQMYKQALHNNLPFVALDYPAVMGARAMDAAIDILAGKPVQRRIEVPVQVVLPRGCETQSVKADIWAEAHVGWDLADDDAILSQGPSLRTRGYERGQSLQ